MPKKPSKLDRFKIANSRRLRAGSTDAEAKLWKHLWRIPIEGTHFRRQVPIGRYFADFACHQIGLIIELDGSQHAASDYDQTRNKFMMSEGWNVARFWSHDVLQDRDSVLETIVAICDGRFVEAVDSRDFRFFPALRS